VTQLQGPVSRHRHHRAQAGQTATEFAMVLPIALMIIFGLISASLLFFQKSSLHDGATAGARMAALETSLVTPTNGKFCESTLPVSIESIVTKAAVLVPVNSAPLCAASAGGTTLTQTPNDPKSINITVVASPSLATPSTVTVNLTFAGQGLAPPMNQVFNLTASSTDPVLSP
jgi:Flp pilus assembly protein TadG